ncbi:MAG: SsrA-binding protein SmpB [Candidatus Melainabacteria bacterium]|uniref:SsrA-binding protein n=1 Tax=Candidatus Obscuribacter phosphatis TaxID=1906157 RepID=A0A8J7PGF0_9BACT|nr:SsrA-binding protein SmpB [Candidatus Obscuribacter phosphatis]MCA0312954.1 SsrA-binding protein SmpB [Candidatus Melainabacteria bacterium]OPZ82937.1 MAG: SsrA-binding protein [bacterium ADurb.Bin425]
MTKQGKAQNEKKKDGDKPVYRTVADNRRARHDFEILETHEAGISLLGTEVKAIRAGKANLQDSHIRIEDGDLWLYNCHISPYDYGNRFNHEPTRKRRLLMHSRQILKLKATTQEKGLTLIPLKLYFKGNLVKVDLAVVRGKKLHDKRDTIAKRETKRQLDRITKTSRY